MKANGLELACDRAGQGGKPLLLIHGWPEMTASGAGPVAAPGAFSPEDVDFMTEPFGDAERFRASIANYEYVGGPRRAPEPPRLTEPNPTPTLILYGPADHAIPRLSAAHGGRVSEPAGAFIVGGAGHFLQWERADVLNGALRCMCLS